MYQETKDNPTQESILPKDSHRWCLDTGRSIARSNQDIYLLDNHTDKSKD
jgi:hypothetical protein